MLGTECACNAYASYQGRWLVQPMFISPRAQLTAGYACSTAKDHGGVTIVDEAGQGIANQVDGIYALP